MSLASRLLLVLLLLGGGLGALAFPAMANPPVVSSINPTSGTTAGGTLVTITGTLFTGATAVDFGSTPATNVTVVNDTTITADSPAGTGTVDVTVTTPGGTSPTSPADEFTFVAPPVPAVTGVSPTSGPAAGGTLVTITGTGFTGATAVDFRTTAATSFTVVNDTTITADSPPGIGGVADVTVTTPGGTSPTSPVDEFTYVIPSPAITGITPVSGPAAGGTLVTITGTAFTGATAVDFGATAATNITVVSDTQITADSSAGTGTVDVTVTTGAGGPSPTSPADQFTYFAPPAITSINPTAGPVAGGTVVTITGTGFTGATVVDFGTTPATSKTVTNDTHITATAPAGTGTVDLTVTTPGGTSATSSADQFTYAAVPAVSTISPAFGPAAGSTLVTITGSGFTGATAVKFGTVAGTALTINSDTSITVKSPAGTAPVDITVVAPGGTSGIVTADKFTYGPTVTALSPAGGPSAGGVTITVTGTGFTAGATVHFGTLLGSGVTVVSATQLTVVAPGASAQTVDVQVTTAAGQSPVNQPGDQYTFGTLPTVTGISPATGPLAGGTAVTITGTNFISASTVKFGTIAAASVSFKSSTQLVATTAAGPASVVDVTVTTPVGTSATSSADQFTYGTGPVITALSFAGGPPAGGNTITIIGSNFGGTTSVLFGTVKAQSFHIASATQVTAVAPAGKLGTTVDVTVTSPNGTSPVVAADKYTYATPPTVTAVSPNMGSALGGTPVTITGTKLTGATSVSFGTVAATVFKVVSDTSVTATVPAGTAGTVDVTVIAAGGPSATSSADQFTYTGVATGGTTYSYSTTLGATGVAKPDNAHFNLPAPGTVDTVNNHLLIADTANDRVQILDSGTLAYVATIGTSGVPSNDNTHLNGPLGVGFDPVTSHILVADSGNARIQIFDARSFAYVSTLGVTGTPGSDNRHFSGPAAIHLNEGTRQLYIADAANDRIQVYNADTLAYVATIGTTDVVGKTNTTFNHPTDAELNPTANEIMVADSGNGRLQLFDPGTFAFIATIGAGTLGPDDSDALGKPVTASFDPINNLVLVADSGPDARVQVYDAMSYNYVLTLGTTGSVGTSNNQFQQPSGIAVDTAHDKLFIGDPLNERVQVYAIGTTPIVASVLPGSRSVQIGHPATIFASLVNSGTTPLQGCQIALPVAAPAGLTFSYQTTNPSTNALTGTPNTPVSIAGKNGLQTFLLTFQGTSAFVADAMAIDFDCLGVGPAPVTTGVDTVDLTLSSTPIADIIALAATPTENGIDVIPGSTGTGAFAVASDNVGVSAQIIVSVDTGTATLALTPTICQSNPSTGACLATPGSSVTVNFTTGLTPTFSIFLKATGAIPLDPANSRVFVRFKDSAGALHGSTSVAVDTQ
jgi:IPT/TIG domain